MAPGCLLDKVKLSTEALHLCTPVTSVGSGSLFSLLGLRKVHSRAFPVSAPHRLFSCLSPSNHSQLQHLCSLLSLLVVTLSSDVMAADTATILFSLGQRDLQLSQLSVILPGCGGTPSTRDAEAGVSL